MAEEKEKKNTKQTTIILSILLILFALTIYFDLVYYITDESCVSDRFECVYYYIEKDEQRIGLTLENTEMNLRAVGGTVIYDEEIIGTCEVEEQIVPLGGQIQFNCLDLNLENLPERRKRDDFKISFQFVPEGRILTVSSVARLHLKFG